MRIFRLIWKIFKTLVVVLISLLLVVVLVGTAPSLWNRLVTYPGLEKERIDLQRKYQKPEQIIPLSSYKGVIHAHTYWSHDSRGTLPEILDAAKQAKLQFIFNSDHKRHQLDTFPRGYQGTYDGIIIESGTEHSSGLMISPFRKTVVDWQRPEAEIIRDIARKGGFTMYVHTEDDHDWDNRDYQAMEIYNIHTDLLDESGILPFVINNTINGSKYMHWGFRELFDEQVDILANWDRLNETRKIVGLGAVDAHNNQSFRARYHDDGMVEWVGPNADTLVIREPTWFDKLMLGEPDKYGWAFKWEMDPYFDSYNFVNNHVFADQFSNTSIKNHILRGHVFVSFESLAEATGFQYYAVNDRNAVTAILGDEVKLSKVDELRAVSPYPVKFQVIKNGKRIKESAEDYQFSYQINAQPGNYRLVARLWIGDEWVPWVYTNPIYVK